MDQTNTFLPQLYGLDTLISREENLNDGSDEMNNHENQDNDYIETSGHESNTQGEVNENNYEIEGRLN
jgi:hypothetical protein